jgi:hypothetical protein
MVVVITADRPLGDTEICATRSSFAIQSVLGSHDSRIFFSALAIESASSLSFTTCRRNFCCASSAPRCPFAAAESLGSVPLRISVSWRSVPSVRSTEKAFPSRTNTTADEPFRKCGLLSRASVAVMRRTRKEPWSTRKMSPFDSTARHFLSGDSSPRAIEGPTVSMCASVTRSGFEPASGWTR